MDQDNIHLIEMEDAKAEYIAAKLLALGAWHDLQKAQAEHDRRSQIESEKQTAFYDAVNRWTEGEY